MHRHVAVAVLGLIAALVHATPLEECSTVDVPVACLDAKLKEANLRLNTTLKAAQVQIEKLQQDGRRSVMGAFVDSQRKFNAYRDAQCAWQAIHAAPGSNPAEYVKDCQIRATVAREQELSAFASGIVAPSALPGALSETITATGEPVVPDPAPVTVEQPIAAPQAESPPSAPAV